MSFEKRRHERFSCEIDSTYKKVGSEFGAVSETIIQDISEGGLRFRANRFLSVHEKLLLKIQIPGQKTIEALAQPAWVREVPSINQFDIGAQFLSLSPEDKETIQAFIGSMSVRREA